MRAKVSLLERRVLDLTSAKSMLELKIDELQGTRVGACAVSSRCVSACVCVVPLSLALSLSLSLSLSLCQRFSAGTD